MRKLTFGLILFSSVQVCNATEIMVSVRNDNQKIVNQLKDIELLDNTKLETKFFKMVRAETDEIISVDNDKSNKESLRAQSTLYHLNKAREFFTNYGLAQSEQITIRIGIEKAFHRKRHFAEPSSKNDRYNNAHTFIPGQANERYNVSEWGSEIWFRNPKKIKFTKKQIETQKEILKKQVPNLGQYSKDSFINTAIYALLAESPEDYLKTSGESIGINLALSYGMKLVIPEVTIWLAPDSWFLDTALLPEVSYHEYTHYIFSDYLPPITNKPIMEGLSDYFATKISGSKKIAHKLGNAGKGISERSADVDIKYTDQYDLSTSTTLGQGSNFVLNLLTALDKHISARKDEDTFLLAVINMRKNLNINSTIADDLTDALLKELPADQKLGVLSIINNYGL